ncbi:MAG: hypothetical protein AB1921_07335 [Thermodesulfobacteriota bacterium]
MKSKGIVAATLVSLFLLAAGFPTAAAAFNMATRKAIVADATAFCPDNLREYLTEHETEVSGGMIFDYLNHSKIKPQQIASVYNLLVARIKSGKLNDPETARGFGVLACMLSEAVAPGFLSSSQDLNPPLVEYDGFTEITDPKGKVEELIESHKAFYGDKRDLVTMAAYELCVNQVADLWTTAWKDAGMEIGPMAEVGKKILREQTIVLDTEAPVVGQAAGGAAGKAGAQAGAPNMPGGGINPTDMLNAITKSMKLPSD